MNWMEKDTIVDWIVSVSLALVIVGAIAAIAALLWWRQ